MNESLLAKKIKKSKRIKHILSDQVDFSEDEFCFNFLPEKIRRTYGLVETTNVSAHDYDKFALELINSSPNGLYLDCGCGKRNEYLDNVVNFEIVNYDTTDVLGIGENLPFQDESFDGVLSLNVLEHVKDPFQCAKEISRVLKKDGKLYCVVPFMSPYHDFPDHYYNMTQSGLKNLFCNYL
ncbi:class I SAM-dependent methyltransferase, partial [Opitutales bacterium]|nr:class I SAM-dependent methyltransferase [Opitutales bacterium]